MARLFISYKREEQAYAFALRQWLISEQDWPPHEVFVDRDKLHAGDAWAEKIFHEAEVCEAMLFLASELSLQPDSFCYKELQRARGVTLVVTLGGLSPDDERLKSALPHGADSRQITALDGQPTAAFEFVSPVDGKHGAVSLNRTQVESIGQTLRDLGIAPNSFTWTATSDGPYRGLEALQEGEEALFFGREREIRDCIHLLEEIGKSVSDRALAIQAPSGAGKSSLLRAGLWRRLRRHAAFSPLAVVRTRHGVLSNEDWGLAAGLVKPEANLLNLPLGALEERVANDLPGLLAEFADADASRTGGRRTMLLGIDQAEEMSALTSDLEIEELRRLFTGLAKAGRSLKLRLVLAVRDDSVDPLLQQLSAFGIAQDAVKTFRLHRMPPPRFKDVIEKPALVAAASGFPIKLDDALATALAEAAAQNQGEFSDSLPILALALQRLVRKRRSPNGTIQADAQSANRLVSEAVAEATKEALEASGADDTKLRRLMIPRLVTWDPRAGEGGAAKRRVATANELFDGERQSLRPLADALVDQRLLTRAGDHYEISHEALLRVSPLGELILELRSKFLRADMLTLEARQWQDFGRRIEWVARTGERLRDSQELANDEDFGAMLSASHLGVGDYLAACEQKDRDERELRERLERYELANLSASVQAHLRQAEVEIEHELLGNGIKVYISYSRRDAEMSRMIADALRQAGFDVMLDLDQISFGEDWQKRIQDMVTETDKMVFLISPASVSSEFSRRDLEMAMRLGKFIVPVLVEDVPFDVLPRDVARLNFVMMRNETEIERGMLALKSALATDLEWVQLHTKFLVRAREWVARKKSKAYLLRGGVLGEAERWLQHRPASAPPPTELQREFIRASRMAALRARHRVVASLTFGLVVSLGLAIVAFNQRNLAMERQHEAESQRMMAERERMNATERQREAEAQRIRAEQAAARVSALETALRRLDAANPLLKP